MDDLFGIKKKKVKEVKEVKDAPKVSIFDYLKDICYGKKGDIHKTKLDYDMSKFDVYMILQYLSLDKGYLPIINIFNQYQEALTKEQMYKSLVCVIPRSNKFLKYPKKIKEDLASENDISILKQFFECSRNEIMEFLRLGLIKNREIKIIKNMYGGRA